jgi:hypothetical protein
MTIGRIDINEKDLSKICGAVIQLEERADDTSIIGAAAFPAGTLMLFQQSSSPVGWTKQTTHNDKALRIVSGTPGTGGSVAFSVVFARTATDSHTLLTSEIASHSHGESHTWSTAPHSSIGVSSGLSNFTFGGPDSVQEGDFSLTVAAAGGAGSHTHPLDMRVQYVDIIIASKD